LKKVIYIAAFVLGVAFVSCQKQDVSPNNQEMDAPAWQDGYGDNARGTSSPEGGGATTTTGGDGKGTVTEDGEITDPNLDPDAD